MIFQLRSSLEGWIQNGKVLNRSLKKERIHSFSKVWLRSISSKHFFVEMSWDSWF